MNALTPLRGGQMPAVFQSRAGLPSMTGAMQAGLTAGYAVISYKGRNWRIKYRGEDTLIRDERNVPMPALNVIIVGVSDKISKQWYDKRFAEGDNEAPDCFSINGEKPDPSSPKKQCDSCAVCPQNLWGSRITENNKKAKACQDTRRLAIVPWGDVENDAFGGPMLLRVPPTSLANVARYGTELERFGAEPFMVATQLSFDLDVAYPLIELQALGWLDNEEGAEVTHWVSDPLVKRILYGEAEAKADPAAETAAEAASPLAGGAPAAAFRQTQQAPEPEPQPEPPAPPPAPEPAPEPPPEPVASRPTPFTRPAAQPAAKATPGFGGPAAKATPQQAPAPVTAVGTAQTLNPAAPVQGAVVQGAPADMNAAIDGLLDNDD